VDAQVVAFAIGHAGNGNIWALFVDPAFEGHGLGRRLHDEMVQWLFAQGLQRLHLGTQTGTRAERFYATAGWLATGLRPDGEMGFELWRDRRRERQPPCPIMPVSVAHAQSYRDCLDIVAREKRYLAQVEALPIERIQAFVQESVRNDAVQFVALDRGRVVGWADVFPGWAHALQHAGSLGMGVHPAYRGQGLGRRLLQACIDKAWRKGLVRIELEVRADNARAIRLYERLGFFHEGIRRRALCFDGQYFDALAMALLKSD
jgi:ribosomal protein S18 acetylase RimI-like enzyme